MLRRCRYVLPIVGLVLFGLVTRDSMRMNSQLHRIPNRYFWWASFRLDSDPLNRRPIDPSRCGGNDENCVQWDLPDVWVDWGWPTKSFTVLSIPALAVGVALTLGLGRLGVSEVWTFMISMPLLVFAWYYCVGILIDRIMSK